MYEFKLPDLGEGIHEGEILKWHVSVGEMIKEDDPLVDVETDKAAVTIPSPKSGKIVSLNGKIGDTISVGDVVAAFAMEGEEVAAPPKVVAPPKVPPPPAVAPPPKVPVAPATPISSKGPIPAAPATRRFARENAIDIRLVAPTGPGGRVTLDDVKRYILETAKKPPAIAEVTKEPEEEKRAAAEFAAHAASAIPFLNIEPMPDFEQWGPVEREPLRSIRRKVAHRMVTSMILAPHVAHMDEADVTLLEEFRKREKERRTGQPGEHLTLLAFVIKAVTAGLRAAPAFNASLDPFKEEIVYKKYYNIGIATDTGRGLIVPVIHDTDRKSILQIAAAIEDLATRARDGKIEVAELRGGTFTITNVGPLGGTALIPAINYPEVAILGIGKVQEKPVVREGQIVIRKILPLTLAFDHRVADGADAARFVSELVRNLSDPNLLLLET
ncbi:MAG: 2-oxo acid dehydrogenase subunit E2 [Calditrichaeota bacterium]|nr:2-oxo acid dehydrogenase subunit E2 [Calditrichota bacterium]